MAARKLRKVNPQVLAKFRDRLKAEVKQEAAGEPVERGGISKRERARRKKRAYEDAVLIEKYRAGDERALDELLSHYSNLILFIAKAVVKEYGEADSVRADVFQRVKDNVLINYRNVDGARFFTWLWRVTVRIGIDHLRKWKREQARIEQIDEIEELAAPVTPAASIASFMLDIRREETRERIEYLRALNNESLDPDEIEKDVEEILEAERSDYEIAAEAGEPIAPSELEPKPRPCWPKRQPRRTKITPAKVQRDTMRLINRRRNRRNEYADDMQYVFMLPPAQQEIMRMYLDAKSMAGLDAPSYCEIAEKLSIPVGTVMSRLHAARKNVEKLKAGETLKKRGRPRVRPLPVEPVVAGKAAWTQPEPPEAPETPEAPKPEPGRMGVVKAPSEVVKVAARRKPTRSNPGKPRVTRKSRLRALKEARQAAKLAAKLAARRGTRRDD